MKVEVVNNDTLYAKTRAADRGQDQRQGKFVCEKRHLKGPLSMPGCDRVRLFTTCTFVIRCLIRLLCCIGAFERKTRKPISGQIARSWGRQVEIRGTVATYRHGALHGRRLRLCDGVQ